MTTPTPATTARCKVGSSLSKDGVRVQSLPSCASGHRELTDLLQEGFGAGVDVVALSRGVVGCGESCVTSEQCVSRRT